MSQNEYFDTLIAVAEDCPTDVAVVPMPRGDKETIATLQYEMLQDSYTYTQSDVLFEVWFTRQNFGMISAPKKRAKRELFFSKAQPCLRSSPLPKRYGFGIVFDHEGRAALCPVDSKEYARHLKKLEVKKAMRSSRKKKK